LSYKKLGKRQVNINEVNMFTDIPFGFINGEPINNSYIGVKPRG